MSLIADALKRAQEQRQGRGSGGDDAGARRLLTPSGPLRVPARKGREVPRSLAMAGFGLAAAIVVFGVVVILSPRMEVRAATAWATEAGSAGGGDAGGVGDRDPSGFAGGVAFPGGAGSQDQASRIGDEYAADLSGDAWVSDGRRPGGAPVLPEPDGGEGYRGAAASGTAGGGRPRAAGDAAGGEAEVGSSFRMTLAGEPPVADLMRRALGAQQAGDLEGAATLYRGALASRPGDPQLHNNLGTVYRAQGMPGQAYDAFEAALAADPGYAPAWNNLGLMLEGQGRVDEAVDAYREAIRLDAANGGARVNLANVYQSLGLSREARGLLETALRDDPGLPEAHYALARLLEAEGDIAGARRHYTLFLNTGRGAFGALEARVRAHIGGER